MIYYMQVYENEVNVLDDLKSIIAKNIIELRRNNGLTQAELAEKLNYSDKAVSKWERAESLPDITVLKAIADMFGVTVDYLLKETHDAEQHELVVHNTRKKRNRMIITAMSVLLVVLVATIVFVNVDILTGLKGLWMTFVYTVPVCLIVWLVFNSIWFNKRNNFIIISLLLWSALLSLFLTFVVLGNNLWLIFLVGVPAQAIILLWSGIRPRSRKKTKQ